MAVKLSSSILTCKIPKLVPLIACMSSISIANRIQIAPEIDQNPPNANEFEPRIQFPRSRLMPDDLIRVLDTTHDLNSAVKVFRWASMQKRFRHTASTYFRMVLKLGLAGNVQEMEGFCNEMVKEKCPGGEEALVNLIRLLVKHRRLSEAIRVLVIMTSAGYKPPIVDFNGLLGALVEQKRDFKDVLLVYKEIVKVGILPNVETLNYLIEALLEINWVDSALDQYRRMRKKGCCPNSKTFEILIIGLIERNLAEKSVIVLREMIEFGCIADLKFYTSVIPLFCQVNKLEEGIRLFRRMRASKLMANSLIYSVLIQCLCENLWLDDAINLLKEMIGCDLTPDDDVFVHLVKGFCKLGKFNEAEIFLEDKCVSGTDPHNALLEGHCAAGNFLAAKDFLGKMSYMNITDNVSWNILIRWLCENACTSKAFELLGRMMVSSFMPDSATYSALVVGNCKLRKYKDGLELFHQVCAKGWFLDSASYSELVETLCQVEKIQEAVEVFCYMSSNKCALQSSSFNVLMKSICATGKLDKAIRMLSLAYYSGTPCTNPTYKTIMLGLSKFDKANDILIVLSKMLVGGCTLDVEAYCILIQTMGAQNRVKDCARFFNLTMSEGLVPDLETLANLLLCLTNHSQLHMILNAVIKLASDGDILNSSMYNLLIHGLWKEGYKSEACRLLDLMLEKGWVPDASTHGLLIGSVGSEVRDGETEAYKNARILQDEIGSILAEGLGET